LWADKLLAAVMQKGYSADWPERMKAAFDDLYGSSGGRYPASAKSVVQVRAPGQSNEDTGVPFAALIHQANPKSGPYGGMSIAIFPGDDDSSCLLSFVVGTNGLAPDEAILGRPGHSRKIGAICGWLNRKYGKKGLRAWAKQEPSRIDQPIPDIDEGAGRRSRDDGARGLANERLGRTGSSTSKKQKRVCTNMKNISKHFRASRAFVLSARYKVLSRFQNLPWRERAKAARMLVELLKPLPVLMEKLPSKESRIHRNQSSEQRRNLGVRARRALCRDPHLDPLPFWERGRFAAKKTPRFFASL